jgi:hypothetical protein
MAGGEEEHVPKIKDSEFNRQTADTETVRNNCTIGYRFSNPAAVGQGGQQQNHHILPIETLQDPRIPNDKLAYWHNCMALTKWDINNSSNLIGLPLTTVFYSYDTSKRPDNQLLGQLTSWNISADTQGGAVNFGTLPDLPSHQIEHNTKGGYNDKVSAYLKKNIWDPLAKKQKPCKADGNEFAAQLNSAGNKWRQFLIDRGTGAHSGGKGAAHCWIHRWDHNGYASFWYIPLSMKPGKPAKKKRPPEYGKKKGSKDDWFDMFYNGI